MPVLSTTALTAADRQLLAEEICGQQAASLTQQLTAAQARLAKLQSQLAAANAGCVATKVAILASKSPPVTVPNGATVSRVGDNLVVTN